MADPWAPPPEQRRSGLGCAIAFFAVAAVVLGGIVVLGVASDVATYLDTQESPAPRSFDDEVRRALRGPADTDHVSPGPDGSRVFAAPAPSYGGDGYRMTLPRGWEGRHVGARSDSRRYLDAVLTFAEAEVTAAVERVEYAQRPGGDAFLVELRNALGGRGLTVPEDASYEPVRAAGLPQAYRVDGSGPGGIGAAVVVFERGTETFQLLVSYPPVEEERVHAALARMLTSWRWT